MTEKRFRRVLGLIEDSNGDLLDLSEIADKMNQLNNENEELKKENNELRQDNDLDTIFGISDEELTKKFESAINRDKEICKSKGLPIAGYDNKNKCAYLEYPDGNKEYVKD